MAQSILIKKADGKFTLLTGTDTGEAKVELTGGYVDAVSGFIGTIPVEHINIHEGILFSILHKVSVVASGVTYVQIKTGAKTVHFKPTNIATDAGKFAIELLESPAVTDGTTPITVVNRDRTSSNTPETVLYSDPTAVSGGTKIDEFYIGGDVGFKATGGDIIAGVIEFILKPNTDYVYKITNEGATRRDYFVADVLL
jgi:hypothetical protein